MRLKKQTLVSVVSPRQNSWQKVRRALVVPLVAWGMFAGLLFLLNQPVETAAAAVQSTLATETSATEAPRERVPQANILYVTAEGSGTTCTIAQPCKIQDAVNAAAEGDEIHVAAGIHDDVVGNGTFTQTVQINKNVTLRGGYTTTNWLAEPDPMVNETILDGLNQGRVIHIFAAAPTIEGFTIRNGRANATVGAGIYKETIQGGVIRNNRIYDNSAIGGSGAGIFTQGADIIVDNDIFDNFSSASGGGIYVTTGGGTPTIQNNRIYNNTSGVAGGTTRGGGIFIFTGEATIEGNIFYGNISNFGGALSVGIGGNVLIQNNIFYNNQALYIGASLGAGGAIEVSDRARIVHNTLVDNQAPNAMGGGLAVTNPIAVVGITNTIVVSNTALSNSGIYNNGTMVGSHNNLFNNSTNATLANPIAGSPRFANYAGDNFHLSANSTNVVDAAINAGVISDIDGQIRPFGLGYDVGADEFYDPAFTCFARVNDGPLFTSIQSAMATVTQASDVVKVAGLCRDTDNEVVLINQSLILRGGYTTTDWINQVYGPTIIDAQGVSGRRGILITAGSPTIDALHITGGNLPSTNGSAVFVSGGTGAILQNLVLYGNTTGGATNGALGVAGLTNPDIQFNTIVNNTGNGVRFDGAGAIHNSILYNNTGTPISGGAGHTFNLIGVNPLFVNAAANDYHLTAQSPAIGAANPNASLSRDFEGDTRPRGNHFDAGADEANEYPAPAFEPDYTDEVDRGTTVTINHVLTNLGTQSDTFSLTGSNNLGWAIDFPTSSGLLLPGESIQVMVVITVPAGASPQQVGVTVITATSALNTNVKDTVVDTITVAQIPGIEFTPTYSNSLLPGEAITYVHTLTNTGDYTDTITVELVSDPFGWAELLPDDPFDVVLASGQITPVVVVVTVPPNAAAGFANTIIIQATSNYEPSVTAVVTDTVTAKATVGTRYVSNAGFDLNNNCTQPATPCLTVKQAVSQASFGDQIRIASGTYAESDISVNDTMFLSGGWTNNFTVQVIDPTLTVINAAQLARIFSLAPGIQPTFSNLTLQNGLSSVVGGGVWVGSGSQPIFNGVHFLDNQSAQGGALYAEANANVRLINSRFEGNTATRNGGGFFMVSGSALISGTTFLDNGAGGTLNLEGGGAIYQQGGNLTIINSLLAENNSARHGGALFARGGTATVDFVTVVGNAAAGSGGAVYNDNAITTLNNTIFSDNTGVTGGALFSNVGTIPNNYDLFWNNLPNNGNVTLGANSVLGDPDYADAAYRLSPNSEAVDSGDPATTLEIDFEGDTRPADSGFDIGYDELAGCLAKRGTVIYASIQEAIDAGVGGNYIQVSGICRGAQGVDIGGGVIVSQTVYLDEPLEIEGGWNSAFSSDDPLVPTFIDPQGAGRGFYITGADGAIIRSLIVVNGEAAGLGGGPGGQDAGGGVYNSTSNIFFEDLTVFESSAQVGGGLYVNSGVITLTNSGLISNTATQGGGLYNNGGTITVANVVLATNAAATGAGFYQNSGSADLLHITAYDNAATGNGGGVFQLAGSITVRSSIFQSNSGVSGPAIFVSAAPSNVNYNYYYDHASTPVVGTGLGTNSVNSNITPPGMIDPANGDYHLADTAAAIDIADPDSPIFYDFDLDPRPSNQGFDMGADELAGCYARVDDIIYGSIQYAIQIADPGATIDVAGRCVGVHRYNTGTALGVISTTVHINKNVILVGGWNLEFSAQDDITFIDPLSEGYAIYVAPNITSTVETFHLINGNGNAPGLNGNGGAIYIQNASPQIMGNSIYDNVATNGSAIYVDNATPTIGGGNRIYTNNATNGSIYVNNVGATTATIVNNFIYQNQATNGAGIYHAAGAANIWHNDFMTNNAVGSGGAVYVAAASPNIRNNILTDNTAGTTGGIRCNTGATPIINYNDYFDNINGNVGGAACTPGANSLFVDPLFVSPPLDNYDLLDNSPLIDAGDPTMTLLVDYEERIRPSHQGWDIGAYELGGCYARNLADLDTIYGSVQWALGQATSGDTIEVDGVCLGVNTQLVSGNPTTQNLFIDKSITIDGNWNSGLPGGGDTAAILQPEEEGRVVYVVSGRTVTLTNIILTNGDANGAGLSDNGGGVYNTGDLTLDSVTIRLSLASAGAGIYNVGPLVVDGSFISENTATNGGGLYNNYAGSTVVTDTQITLNIATASGAGIYQNLGTLQVEANQIFANVGSASGGGVYQNSAVLRLLRNEIYNNTSSGNGGGIFLNAATGANQVYNNFIYDNQATTGGGLYNATTNTGIWHNTFVENGATGNNGGGLFSAGGNPIIRNNIVQSSTGTGIHATGGVPSIGFNNVVGNSGAAYGGIASDSGGGIAQAPDYVDAAVNNYRLQYGSPGIDVGDPASPVAVDIDGDDRPNNDEFDMGADELTSCLIRVGTAIFHHLQDAINYAEANDIYTVEIARGECRGVRPDPVTQTTLQVGYVRENLNFIGSLSRIDFSDPDDYHEIGFNTTLINAEDEGRVIVIASPTAVVSFTHVALVNGNAFVANDGNSHGGGVYNPSGSFYASESNICESQASDGGGYYGGASASTYFNGASTGVCTVVLIGDNNETQDTLLFFGNTATGNGGGIYSAGNLTAVNLGLWVNSAGNHGGGAYNSSAAARFTNAIFFGNTALANGGGLYNTGNNLEIYHNTIRDNEAQNGGGIFNAGGGLILNSSIIYNNTASVTGGGLNTAGGTLDYNNFNQNSPQNSTIGEGTNAYLGDPGFAMGGLYYLDYTSNNIDSADPTLVSPPLSIDFDAQLDSRPDNLPPHNGLWEYRSDVGADEYAKEFSCILEPETRTLSGAAGDLVVHTFILRNDGNFTDTITVTLQSSSMGWATLVGGTQSFLLDPDETRSIVLEVSIPLTATVDMADTSIIGCQSLSIPDNTATATAITQVALIQGVIVDPDHTAFALPGEVLTFTHTIKNAGNRTEEVQIIPNSGPQFANASLYNLDGTPFFPDVVTLDGSEVITLLLRVTIFEDAMGGGIARPGVVARLVAQPDISDAAQDTITIGYVAGTRYLAATGSVDNSNCTNLNNPCATLQHAINQAADGDDILLSLGTYTDFVTRTVGIEVVEQNAFVDKDVSIIGGYNAGDGYTSFQPITNSVTLDGQDSRRVFYIATGTDVTLMGLFVVNGYHPDFGGAIYHADGDLTILGSWIQDSRAQYGGGLYHTDGTLTVNSSVVAANRANNADNTQPGEGAGIYIAAGTAVLENNTLAENRNELTPLAPMSTGNGGALFQATGNLTLLNNIFALNVAVGEGSAYFISPTVTIVDNDYSLFFNNGLNYANVPTGTNSFSADPLFADTFYHLSEGSPAVDVGTSAIILGLDFDGEPRQQGIAVDRGADELTQVADFAFVPPFQSALIDSGERYTYTHVLTNTGDFADSYTLVAGHNTTGGTGWGYTFFPTSTGLLNPGDSIQVTFVITGDGPGYVDTTVITATSAVSSLSLAVTDETTISQIAGVDIEPPRFGSSVAGGTVNYTHTVTNTGDGPDSFDLTVADSNPPGWTINISPENTGVLLPGESALITVTIQVPAVVTVTVHTATIQATSVADPLVNDSVLDTTNLFIAGVELEPDYFEVVDAGTVITYVHTLTNTGNVSDTFDLTATSSLGWLVSYEPLSVTLDVLETAQVMVVVSVPPTAMPGEQDDTVITATSTFNPLVSDAAADQTRVTQNHGLTFTPNHTRTVLANTVQVYTHTLTNTGDGPDTFAIAVSSSEGWTVAVGPDNVTLGSGLSSVVMVTVTVPGGATPGTVDITTVTATSTISPTFFATVTDTTTVAGGGGTSGVLIGPNNSDTALPGDTLVYQHVITNTGTASDNYALTVLSSQGWTVDVGPDNVTLGSGLTSVVVVTVTVPGGATPGTVDVTTVTATSTISPTVSDNATDTTNVLADGAGVVIGPDNAAIGAPGTDVVYTHRVTNTGNAADFFSFNISSSQGWDTVYDPTFASLAAGESAPVTVTVSIPAAATAGTIDVTTIFATSSNDPTVQDTATDTTTVEGTPPSSGDIYLPIIYKPCIPTGVDLVVTALEIVPANPQAGQTVTVRVTIRNQGTTSVALGNNFYVDFYVDRIPGPVVPGDIQWGAQGSWMAAGASRTLSANYVFTGGTHQLWAQVDTDNTVNECPNENNNVLGPINLTVTGTANEPIPVITPVAPAPLDLPRPTPTPGALDEQDSTPIEAPVEVPVESGPITPPEQ